mmetsp:Transcript_3424/g.10473  ORF Transcript_3424/g.10473 Transcript_3424/m.10473 type:complete len:120 (+) Transcript_3424:121-480(+)|eukprot:CAMPEP_0175266322 /NCGR_PEP_ID=MMETSP0093-20121207/43272_1 /TAXON_ID=311494 /ORGANISM="Alexandrium monilatum, Strain CCMP3105" /LENGTH=119 /DNA_ID=CAMNT_0016560921 /DNA_START=62 /DNA_END=421 /DNA_ORIENTATION=+
MSLKEKKTKMPPAVEQEGVKRKHKRTQSYSSYIYKVLKQVHPKLRISKQAMSVMESCVTDTFERLATEANRLGRLSKKETLTSREVQSAVRLVFPGELSKHAVSEGCKAVMKYNAGGDR